MFESNWAYVTTMFSTRTSVTSIWGAQGPQDRSRGGWSLATWAPTSMQGSKKQFVQRWKGLLRAQCYGKSTRLQSRTLPVGGVACRWRPLVHFLPKISLQIELYWELLGSSEVVHVRQLQLYFSGVVQCSPMHFCKCSDCGNPLVCATCV
jgi:hypothetical protein